MITNARSAEDHFAIADYYRGEACLLRGRIEEHQRLAHVYDGRSAWAEEFRVRQIEHCMAAAKSQGELMSTYEELAREHAEKARQLR
jgi:hypothetical protein